MNAWEQVDMIANEALMHLEDSLIISNLTARDKTADFNTKPNGYAVGESVRIKTRPDYEAKEFVTEVEAQGIRESTRSMKIEKHLDVSVEITAKEKALDFESFAEQVIRPAIYRLAEKTDRYVGTKILQAAGLYASDALFDSAADMALARKSANFNQLEPQGRYCLADDTLEATLLGKDYFIKHQSRGDDGPLVFRDAALGRAMGMQFYPTLHFPEWTHSAGEGAAVTDNNSGANNLIGMKVLTVDEVDFSVNGLVDGDRIEIAGVRRPLIVDGAHAGAATTEIALVDPITEIIPDNAAVTVVASGTTNITARGAIFDSQSLAIAMPVLDKPSDKPSFVVSSNGFSIRVVTGYDMKVKKEMMSLDLLVGAAAYDPRRITLLGEY